MTIIIIIIIIIIYIYKLVSNITLGYIAGSLVKRNHLFLISVHLECM